MFLIRGNTILVIITSLLQNVRPEPNAVTPLSKQIQAPNLPDPRNSLSGIASIFSPRMDFDQWKPLTGRGDPLRNDPTYDYEPPMLEKVHYWADDTRLEREHYPEKKSEVLVLGVSSRKPSVSSRPPIPPKRHHLPPSPMYEDYTYKFNEHYPMTILVPPPLPPVGYKPSLFTPSETKLLRPTPPTNFVTATLPSSYTISTPELITSFALQEANLIYEATDNNQTWFIDFNKTQTVPSNTVSSDYAGWGPTTPFNDEKTQNILNNLIPHRESPTNFVVNISPPKIPIVVEQTTTPNPAIPTFLPTVLPPLKPTVSDIQEIWPYYEKSSVETTTESQVSFPDTTTETDTTVRLQTNAVNMLGAMMSMPMVTDPERPEDNLYAYASENTQVFKEHTPEDKIKLEVMQTMQPPPILHQTSTTPIYKQPYHVNPHILNSLLHETQPSQTHDPYLHMRFTTPLTPTSEPAVLSHDTTDPTPMHLIIQGHSKVKTYGSKPKPASNAITDTDDSKQYTTNEVKHLHPIKEKYFKKPENKESSRTSRSQNLTSLVEAGIGSIEIQEADVGIKYDVSDGGKVPVEIYRKGFVENDDVNYSLVKDNNIKREKRQVDLNDLIPFDEETLEELVYNFFDARKNNTGISGFIAKAITHDVSTAVKYALKEDNDDNVDRGHKKR